MKYIFTISLLIFISCDEDPEIYNEVDGCMDNTACNFNADAIIATDCEYIVDECIKAGITEIIFIISKKKKSIKKYFYNDAFYRKLIRCQQIIQ